MANEKDQAGRLLAALEQCEAKVRSEMEERAAAEQAAADARNASDAAFQNAIHKSMNEISRVICQRPGDVAQATGNGGSHGAPTMMKLTVTKIGHQPVAGTAECVLQFEPDTGTIAIIWALPRGRREAGHVAPKAVTEDLVWSQVGGFLKELAVGQIATRASE